MFGKYWQAMQPPYKGVFTTMAGMAWARGAIFWGSDCGKQMMLARGFDGATATVLPPLVVSPLVQLVNMPIIRGTITIQNPASPHNSPSEALRHIYATKGVRGLWHGTSAGVMKTVPKYCTAVVVKEWAEAKLPRLSDSTASTAPLRWSALRAAVVTEADDDHVPGNISVDSVEPVPFAERSVTCAGMRC